jgi:hypothetical protein
VQLQETGKNFFASMTTRPALFSFLAMTVADIDIDKQIITIHHTDVICTKHQDVSGLTPCTHEEADTRILLHVKDAVQQEYNKVSIRTVDTDVVVLLITSAQHFNISDSFGYRETFSVHRYS